MLLIDQEVQPSPVYIDMSKVISAVISNYLIIINNDMTRLYRNVYIQYLNEVNSMIPGVMVSECN